VVVPCEHPKFAFTSLVNHFFPAAVVTAWPGVDEPAIDGSARIGSRVLLSHGVVIGSGVEIGDDVRIGPNTCVANTTIANEVTIGANCTIGLPGFGYDKSPTGEYLRFPHLGRIRIGNGVDIGSNTCIDRGSLGDTLIGDGAKIDNLVHIAHNVVLGKRVVVIANSMIGGSTTVDDDVWIAPSASLMNQVKIGSAAVLGLGSVVLKDVPADAVMVGNPARPLEPRGDKP
jgi:UDP-3-O-[3-hydroxymyristoyl] glucosamine N-acyltransferase